jgi:lipoate-protein ligase A
MHLDCRLIIDEVADGAWNMAVDEALVERAVAEGVATLRLYQWLPTLSLGYFQKYAERESHAASAGLPCVRRSSGGGALVHDRELTYSLALPASALAGVDTRGLYCKAHKAIIAAVAELGGDASRLSLCDPEKQPRPEREPFLCFLRRADGDLLVEGPFPEQPVVLGQPLATDLRPSAMAKGGVRGRYKVCGSAQRKRRGALLQHGGVLLAQSPAAPELPGLKELGVVSVDAAALTPILARELSNGLDLVFTGDGRCEMSKLRPAELRAAQQIVTEKYGSDAWTRRN